VPGDRYGRACGRGATATQPLGPCACGLDRKLLGLRLWPLSMPSVWHSSACMGRASRRSPERLAGPRADLGRTWDREIQDRVHCTGSRGPGAYCPTFLILHPHRAREACREILNTAGNGEHCYRPTPACQGTISTFMCRVLSDRAGPCLRRALDSTVQNGVRASSLSSTRYPQHLDGSNSFRN